MIITLNVFYIIQNQDETWNWWLIRCIFSEVIVSRLTWSKQFFHVCLCSTQHIRTGVRFTSHVCGVWKRKRTSRCVRAHKGALGLISRWNQANSIHLLRNAGKHGIEEGRAMPMPFLFDNCRQSSFHSRQERAFQSLNGISLYPWTPLL